MKKKISRIMILTALVMIFTCNMIAVKASAASQKAWEKAYTKIIKQQNQLDKKEKYSQYTYSLIYFNNDKIPELVVGHSGYWVSMYTYDKGHVYQVMDHWSYGAMGNCGYEYIPKKNVLRNSNSDYAGAVRYTYFGKMKNHKIISRYAKSICLSYYKLANGRFNIDKVLKNPLYYYGTKRISKKKYNNYQIKGNYKTIIGTMSYSKMKKKLA